MKEVCVAGETLLDRHLTVKDMKEGHFFEGRINVTINIIR